MPEHDAVLTAIGELKAGIASVQSTQTAILENLKDGKERFQDQETRIRDLEKTKNKAIGVAMVGGPAAVAAWEMIKHFYKGITP